MPKRKSYDQQFKEETIQYVRDHPEMSVKAIANERGVSFSTLNLWIRNYNLSVDANQKIQRGGVAPSGTGFRHDAKTKEAALQYVREHPEMSVKQIADALQLSFSTLSVWIRKYNESAPAKMKLRKKGKTSQKKGMRRARYTNHTKEEAIMYVRQHPEMSMRDIAARLEVKFSSLNLWIRKYNETAAPEDRIVRERRGRKKKVVELPTENEELLALREENKKLREMLEAIRATLSMYHS